MAGKTKNRMWLDTSGMAEWIERLDKVSDDLEGIVETAITEVAETIQADVEKAMEDVNLPNLGRYATGETKRTIIERPKVVWDGGKVTVNIGFDQTVPGASVYLITGVRGKNADGTPLVGRPRMEPNIKLVRIFRQKTYMKKRTEELEIFLKDEWEYITGEVFD